MGAVWASSMMPGEDGGSEVEHARKQQVIASNAGEDDLEGASGAAATGTDVERDENVEAIYEDAINEADKARSFVHGALNSCFESIFMALVGLQLQKLPHELSEVETVNQTFTPSDIAFFGTILITASVFWLIQCFCLWWRFSVSSEVFKLRARQSLDYTRAGSVFLTGGFIFAMQEVKIKIIQDPSHLVFLAMGTFTSVVNYTAGAKATLKVHEKGVYTFPMKKISPLLYLSLEFIAAPVFVVVGSLIAWCAMLLVMVLICLLPIFYIMEIIKGERVDFVEIALSVASLPIKCSLVGLNLALEGPGSLISIGGDRPAAAIDSSRILNASGIIIDVLVWVILFTNLSYS